MVVGEFLRLLDSHEMYIILEEVLGLSKTEIILGKNIEISREKEEEILDIVEKRRRGQPLQYLLGHWKFFGFDLITRPPILIPRPETELVVEKALTYIKDGMNVLEIGTGTGAISIAIAKNRNVSITAVDIDERAVNLSNENFEKHGLDIKAFQSDLYQNVKGTFDIIISNPPYIPSGEKESLEKELSFESDYALYSGKDGLDLIRLIISSSYCLKSNGIMILEIGHDQGDKVEEIFRENNFISEIYKDYNGFDRIAIGRKK